MNNKKLNIVRKKIDNLDYRLLNIIKKRTDLVKNVIKLKKKIDPRITQRIWLSMIKSYIEYEKRNFRKK